MTDCEHINTAPIGHTTGSFRLCYDLILDPDYTKLTDTQAPEDQETSGSQPIIAPQENAYESHTCVGICTQKPQDIDLAWYG